MLKKIILLILISGFIPVNAVLAEEHMISDLICPCECAMDVSTCDCPTAVQVKNEINQMKAHGFSENQIYSALQAEYGRDIIAQSETSDSMLLGMGAASLIILFLCIGYIFTKKPGLVKIPDKKKYEQMFEEEYSKFVFEFDGYEDINSLRKGSSKMEEN